MDQYTLYSKFSVLNSELIMTMKWTELEVKVKVEVNMRFLLDLLQKVLNNYNNCEVGVAYTKGRV